MTEDQLYLLEKAHKSLNAAKILLDNGYTSDAASRAYYSSFYVAEAFLEGEGKSFASHSAVISTFGRNFANAGKVPVEFHRMLLDSERLRHKADYSRHSNVSSQQAQEQITRAKQFVQLGNQLIAKPHYQSLYEQYAQQVGNAGTQIQVDYQIALGAFQGGLNYQDTAYVLAQSPQCQGLKPDITKAKEYVENILRQAQPEVQRSQDSDIDLNL